MSPGGGLVIQSDHWSTLSVDHTPPSHLTQDASPSHSIWIITFLDFIPISAKASSTGTPPVVIAATNPYLYQAPCVLLVITFLVVKPKNLTGGKFAIVTCLSSSIFSFVNRITGRWSANSFNNSESASMEKSVYAFSITFSLHCYVDLFYRNNILHCYIILSDRFHIKNWYCNN